MEKLKCDNCDCCEGLTAITVSMETVKSAFAMAQMFFDFDLPSARSFYDETMVKARDIGEGPEDWIDEARVKYEAVIKDAWPAFKNESYAGNSIVSAAKKFNVALDAAVAELKQEIKVAMDEFLGEVSESAKEEYQSLMDKAVEEYAFWGASAFLTFDRIVRESIGLDTDYGCKKSSTQQKQKPESASSKIAAKETEKGMPSSSSAGKKPVEHEEKLVDWALENQTTIKALSQLMEQHSVKKGMSKSPTQQEKSQSNEQQSKAKAKVQNPRAGQPTEDSKGKMTNVEDH